MRLRRSFSAFHAGLDAGNGARTARAWRAALILSAAAVALEAAPLAAQSVRGVVLDNSSNRPLEGAVVTILNASGADIGKRPARSDSLGRFIVHAGEVGSYQLRATRIGYRPATSSSIFFTLGAQVANVTLSMTADATKLSTVLVTGTTRLNTYELMSYVGFDLRMSKGLGKFLDTAELARYKRQPIGHVLEDGKGHYGLDFIRTQTAVDRLVVTSGLLACFPEIWVDGFESALPILMGFGSDQLYGVEIYNSVTIPPPSIGALIGSAQTLPTSFFPNPNYGRGMGRARSQMKCCGAVLVWTKNYVRELQEKEKRKPPS